MMYFSFFFFFSSRRRHTRCGRDWSSDVCSSDLRRDLVVRERPVRSPETHGERQRLAALPCLRPGVQVERSEERRVGKECRSWEWPEHVRIITRREELGSERVVD